ncbi:glycerophosphodiester phosphodiesterase [Candidatus Uabimicrobium sp. HlEnr_7]|uniref:glycerophosphodiester phosphodiesterase n=1 Tax=Candidatus Uabimicrobium helgolandensis TaxID=3095367 RepID=UPI003556321B
MRKYILIVLVSLNIWAQENPFLHGQQQPHNVLIIAHRGASAYAPENTMIAFEKAIAMGAHMFELDVHLSKDDIAVVFHDDVLTKCTNAAQVFPDRKSYFVADFTYEELQKLDAGSWFLKKIPNISYTQQEQKFITKEDLKLYASGNVKIPSLEEVLRFVKKKNCYVNIEIKAVSQFYPNIAEKIVELIEKEKVEAQVLISSFDHYQLVKCKKYNKKIATAALCVERIFNPGNYCKMIQADAANLNLRTFGFDSISFRHKKELPIEPLTNTLKEGIKTNVWTVNDPQQMQILIHSGVGGIISDHPNRVVQVINQLSKEKE